MPVDNGRPAHARHGLLPHALGVLGVMLVALTLPVGAPAQPGRAPVQSLAPASPTSVVFAADGAGNFQTASAMLRKVVREDGLPLDVQPIEWSHGYGRIVSDQCIYNHARHKGRELAAVIEDYHAAHPDRLVFLYGHSAGCSVVVAALEALPPDIVERVVFLSPSMSSNYDLSRALANVRGGLHVFHSRRDWWYLGLVTSLLGTGDRQLAWSSGRVGFVVPPDELQGDAAAKLTQRAWQPEDRLLGNNGGHYGNYQPAFLRVHVVPLLLS